MDGPTRNRIRQALIAAASQIEDGLAARNRLICEGDEAGINKAELGELCGLSRQQIHNILAKEIQQ